MSWSQKTIARILLLIAAMIADSDDLRRELRHLANHISVGSREDSNPATKRAAE